MISREQTPRSTLLVTVLVLVGFVAVPAPVAAQPTLTTDTVAETGSTITVETDGADAIGIEAPSNYVVNNLSDTGQQQPDGAIWNNPPETVSFTLTPPNNVSLTESVDITVTGAETYTHTLDIVEEPDVELVEDTVKENGSTVTINHAGSAAVAVDSFEPESVDITNISGVGQSQPGGVIWNGPQSETVSFKLTPTDSASPGDTIAFDVTTDQVTSVSVEVIEEPVVEAPPGVNQEAAAAVADDDGSFTPSSIAISINKNAQDGNVDGVEVSPSEFALIISANTDS